MRSSFQVSKLTVIHPCASIYCKHVLNIFESLRHTFQWFPKKCPQALSPESHQLVSAVAVPMPFPWQRISLAPGEKRLATNSQLASPEPQPIPNLFGKGEVFVFGSLGIFDVLLLLEEFLICIGLFLLTHAMAMDDAHGRSQTCSRKFKP